VRGWGGGGADVNIVQVQQGPITVTKIKLQILFEFS